MDQTTPPVEEAGKIEEPNLIPTVAEGLDATIEVKVDTSFTFNHATTTYEEAVGYTLPEIKALGIKIHELLKAIVLNGVTMDELVMHVATYGSDSKGARIAGSRVMHQFLNDVKNDQELLKLVLFIGTRKILQQSTETFLHFDFPTTVERLEAEGLIEIVDSGTPGFDPNFAIKVVKPTAQA